MKEKNRVSRFIDLALGISLDIEKVPRWRLFIASIFLGKRVNKSILKFKEL